MIDGCFWHGCPKLGTEPRDNAEWWKVKPALNIDRDRDGTRTANTDEPLGWFCDFGSINRSM